MDNLLYSVLREVHSCCFLTVRKVTKIILWIEFLSSLIMSVLPIMRILLEDDFVPKIKKNGLFDGAVFNLFVVNNVAFGMLPTFLAWWGERKNNAAYLRLCMAIRILDIVRFATIVLLEILISIRHQERPHLFEMVAVLFYGASQIFFLLCSFVLLFLGGENKNWAEFMTFAVALFFYVLHWYLTNVIYSYYLEMKERIARMAEGLAEAADVVFNTADASVFVRIPSPGPSHSSDWMTSRESSSS